MSIGDVLDQSLGKIERQLTDLQGLCVQLKTENHQLRKDLDILREMVNSLSPASVSSETDATNTNLETTTIAKTKGDHQENNAPFSDGKNEATEEDNDQTEMSQVNNPPDDSYRYCFVEDEGDGDLTLIEVEEEYKEHAVYLIVRNGDKADLFFNVESTSHVLPTAETYIIPFFDCDIQSGNQMPSTVTCIAMGAASLIEEGKWKVVRKPKIVIN